jgi:hypothetical protein
MESLPSRRSPRRTNSPQSGNQWNFGNINVSPNDQSRDSQANHDVASDLVVPGLVADDNENVDVQLAQPDFESCDPYSVLGVPQQATICQIKMTYHKLSKQYHPDRLPLLPNQQDVHTTFAAIANTYEVLKDPDKRREYDFQRSLHTDIISYQSMHSQQDHPLSPQTDSTSVHQTLSSVRCIRAPL